MTTSGQRHAEWLDLITRSNQSMGSADLTLFGRGHNYGSFQASWRALHILRGQGWRRRPSPRWLGGSTPKI